MASFDLSSVSVPPTPTTPAVFAAAGAAGTPQLQDCTSIPDDRVGLPVVDLSAFYGDEATYTDNKKEVVASIRNACEEYGAFYVKNSHLPLDDEIIVERCKEFFGLPLISKQKVAASAETEHRGYANNVSEDNRKPNECREWMYMGEKGDNQWLGEETLPGWKEDIQRFFSVMQETGKMLFEAFSLALFEEREILEKEFGSEACMLLLRYPKPDIPNQLGCPEHTDVGFMGINLQDAKGGLQAQLQDGEWVDVPRRPGMFVCTIGDAMSIITDHRWRAFPHRVLHRRQGYRIGVVLFINPSKDTVLRFIPSEHNPAGEAGDGSSDDSVRETYGEMHTRRLGELKY